jgi:hypothetical protein
MRAIVMLAAIVCLGVCPDAHAQVSKPATIKPDTSTRVVKLLEGSGYRYEKLSNTQWLMNFEGEHLDDINVYLLVTDLELTLLAVIGAAGEIDQTAGAAQQLLRANNRRDGLVIYLDSDEDYVVVSRHQLRQLNAESFKAALQSIAGAADDSYRDIRSATTAAPAATSALDPNPYRVPDSANQAVKFLNGRATISIDSARWKPAKSDEPGRLNFQHASGDVQAMVIAERIAIPIDKLKVIALNNAREVSKDVKVVEEGRRNVNGVEVALMRLEGTVEGVPFTYLGYYYGGDQGAIQVITYTGRNLFDEHRREMEAFLNGFRLK